MPAAPRPIRDSLEAAMVQVIERERDQMLWEIRLYAARNSRMHETALDLRGKARYDELLEVPRDDINAIEHLLPEGKSQEKDNYRKMVIRYRDKWWYNKEVGGERIQLFKTQATKQHELQELNKIKSKVIEKKPPEEKLSQSDRIERILNNIDQRITSHGSIIEDNSKKIQAIGEAVASATSINKTQKRVLSIALLGDQETHSISFALFI